MAKEIKKDQKKVDRARTMPESEIVKNSESLAALVLDKEFKASELSMSMVCNKYACSKPLAEKIFLGALPKLIAGKKVVALVDDEPVANSDTPFINNKGTIVISKTALDSMPSFTTWKDSKAKFVVEEKDGTITLTPVA